MKASDRCIALIAGFEGYRAMPYQDIVGKMTVGYGHLIKPGETFNGGLSEAEATALLCRDLEDAEAAIEDAVDVPLLQSQFDALCSFTFNLGGNSLRKSTLLQRLNRSDYTGAADALLDWCKAGGVRVPGLLRRREAERALFLSGDA